MIDAAGWGLGMGLISHTTVLPLFVSRLTSSDLAVGMIQAVMHFGWLIPGILVSGWVERLPRVKASVLWVAALERLLLLLMVPACVLLGPRHPGALLATFFTGWFIMNFAMGANSPGYYKLIAKTIPPHLRGRLYGIGGAVSGLVGVGTAELGKWLLSRWGYPNAYAACFFAAFVLQTVSVLPLAFMREQRQPEEHAPPRAGLGEALRVVREDARLRWLVTGMALFSLNQVAAAFYTLFAIQKLGAGEVTVALFTQVVMGSKTVAFLLAGWLGDHRGNRTALLWATLAGTLAAALAWVSPSIGWLFLVFALNEVAIQGWGVCAFNYVLELCPPERASTYTALYGALTGPFRVGLPLLGGLLAASTGFPVLFALSALGGMIAVWIILARMAEPRKST